MEMINELFKETWFSRILYSMITIIFSYLMYRFIITFFISSIEKSNLKKSDNKRAKTYIKLIRSIVKYTMIIITVFVLLQINGVNISSMIAGVGIISIILGFAIQDALKDIIKGFDIISDSYYQVGDVIKFDNITGKVLSIGLKTTKVEDVNTFNIVSIANRNIEKVEVVSNMINIDIPISYDIKVTKAEKVINEIVDIISKDENTDKCEYRGINDISTSFLKYHIKVYCNPINKVQVRRDALRYIMTTLEKNKISIPYTQIDIHEK